MKTQTQVDVARAFIEAFRSGGVEAVIPYSRSDVEIHSAPGWAGKPLYLGHDGARELAAEWTESFQEYGWGPATYEEAGKRGVIDGDMVGTVRFFFSFEEARSAP